MNRQVITLNADRKVTLTAFLQEVDGEFPNISKRPSVLVLPGGGYTMCSEREADPVAFRYLAAGFQTFVLRYSVGHDAIWPAPLEDLECAMTYIRSKTEDWNLYIDKLAVIGFSAGGHLAGCAATMVKERANAAILGYSALMGESIQIYSPTAPDVISAVDDHTCPCFLFTSRTDNMVPVQNTLAMAQALTAHGISYEAHIYAFGPHGFSTCDSSVTAPGTAFCSRIPSWVDDSIAWLKDVFGDFGSGALSKPAVTSHVDGNRAEYLSVDCTVAYLLKQSGAAAIVMSILQPPAGGMEPAKPSDPRDPSMDGEKLMGMMTLRQILTYGGASDESISAIDSQLQRIPNLE